MQTVKHWAQIDNGVVTGIKQIKARTHVDQAGCIEITANQYNAIRSNPDREYYQQGSELAWRMKDIPYTEARKNEYPPVEDQIGALMKAADGDDSELQTLLQAIRSVKEKYPKT